MHQPPLVVFFGVVAGLKWIQGFVSRLFDDRQSNLDFVPDGFGADVQPSVAAPVIELDLYLHTATFRPPSLASEPYQQDPLDVATRRQGVADSTRPTHAPRHSGG